MSDSHSKPLFIYVSGPYRADSPEEIQNNIDRANEIGLALDRKGHYPFIPHTMMKGWEDESRVERKRALHIGVQWVPRCDALFFMKGGERSEGSMMELDEARKHNRMTIYYDLEKVPDASGERSVISQSVLRAYLAEYEQCAESYRHTYETIWQAGGLLAAVSTAFLALSNSPMLCVLSPAPLVLWFLGVFLPMNRYGEKRSSRLLEIEEGLNESVPGLHMGHFIEYHKSRNDPDYSILERIKNREWRVNQIVRLSFAFLLLLWPFIIWWGLPHIKEATSFLGIWP